MLVDNEKFLLELKKLFEATKASGTVYLTYKRFTQRPPSKKKAAAAATAAPTTGATTTTTAASASTSVPDQSPQCLVRLSDGKAIKFSTRVKVKDIPKYQSAYSAMLKGQVFDSLQKPSKQKAPTAQ